jgi:hypothetical protein
MLARLAAGGDIGISRFWHDAHLMSYFGMAVVDGCYLGHKDSLICGPWQLHALDQAAKQ